MTDNPEVPSNRETALEIVQTGIREFGSGYSIVVDKFVESITAALDAKDAAREGNSYDAAWPREESRYSDHSGNAQRLRAIANLLGTARRTPTAPQPWLEFAGRVHDGLCRPDWHHRLCYEVHELVMDTPAPPSGADTATAAGSDDHPEVSAASPVDGFIAGSLPTNRMLAWRSWLEQRIDATPNSSGQLNATYAVLCELLELRAAAPPPPSGEPCETYPGSDCRACGLDRSEWCAACLSRSATPPPATLRAALAELVEAVQDAGGATEWQNEAARKGAAALAGAGPDPVRTVLDEIAAERVRQDDKWGEQNHPSLDPVLLNQPGGCTPERMAKEYEIPTEARAKFLCQTNAERGTCTYAHILIEEVAEAVAAGVKSEAALREELVQAAAVTVAWIEKIDRAALAGAAREPEGQEGATDG